MMNPALNGGIRGGQSELVNSLAAPRDVPQVSLQLSRLDDLTMALKDVIQQLEDRLEAVMRYDDPKEQTCSPSATPVLAPLAETLANKNDRLQTSLGHIHSLINRLEI